MKALMLGVGHFPAERKLVALGAEPEQPEWTTLDINPECKPDILFDLGFLETGSQLPIAPESLDEIHAYQVLEHFGQQGDYRGFFSTFRELWRVLKPGGVLYGDTPSLSSPWLWGDPGHCRAILPQTLLFLTRKCYEGLGKNTSTDYRAFVAPNWWVILHSAEEAGRHGFVLRKSE
jgi:SAM-dependent methyltransferase